MPKGNPPMPRTSRKPADPGLARDLERNKREANQGNRSPTDPQRDSNVQTHPKDGRKYGTTRP